MRDLALTRWLALTLLATGLTSASTAAGTPRAPGSVFYRCAIVRKFLVPNASGQPPSFVDSSKKKAQSKQWPPTSPGPEILQARAEVEFDGRISRLSMEWLQAGSLGWPYSNRVDADNVYLQATFGDGTLYEVPIGAEPRASFDPEMLVIRIVVLSQKKFKRQTAIRLSRTMHYGFGGLAGVPAWGHSAEITFGWPELRAFAGDQTMLTVDVSELPRDPQKQEEFIKHTWLDIKPIPVVIEQMRLAEQDLRAMAVNASARCEKAVVEEEDQSRIDIL